MNRIKFSDKHGQKQRHYYTRACATQRGIVTPFAPGTGEFYPRGTTEHHQHHHHPQKLLHFSAGFIMANKYFTIRLPVRRTALGSNIVPGKGHRDGRGKEPTQGAEIHRQQRHWGYGYL